MTYRVLVVDDDSSSWTLLTRLLERPSFELSLACNLRSALTLLQDETKGCDLILLEPSLAADDGLQFLRALKHESRLAHIPVILQTASASPERVARGLDAGASYYLAKPIQPDLLMALIRSALSEATDRRSIQPRGRAPSRLVQCLKEAEFRFRTLPEARELATELSGLCPEPERVALGLTELMVNAIEHGNLEISYAEKSQLCRANAWQSEVERRLEQADYRNRMAHVHVSRGIGSLQFLVRDEGPGFPWRDFLELDPTRAFAPNGRGIALARELAFSKLDYVDPGNVVVARVSTRQDA
jgi:DNA-binding response OmpR family regulator